MELPTTNRSTGLQCTVLVDAIFLSFIVLYFGTLSSMVLLVEY